MNTYRCRGVDASKVYEHYHLHDGGNVPVLRGAFDHPREHIIRHLLAAVDCIHPLLDNGANSLQGQLLPLVDGSKTDGKPGIPSADGYTRTSEDTIRGSPLKPLRQVPHDEGRDCNVHGEGNRVFNMPLVIRCGRPD